MCLIRHQKKSSAAPASIGLKRARPASGSASGPVAKKGKLEPVLVVADAGAEAASNKPKSLVEAARLGNVASIQEFLDAGEDVNQTSVGSTSLHYAVFYNHFEAARLLIENYADIDAQNDLGLTPPLS